MFSEHSFQRTHRDTKAWGITHSFPKKFYLPLKCIIQNSSQETFSRKVGNIVKGNTHGSTISLILPPFNYLCLYTDVKGTNTKWMSMDDSFREMIKLRESPAPLVISNLIEEEIWENHVQKIIQAQFFFRKGKKWQGGGRLVRSSFMCITNHHTLLITLEPGCCLTSEGSTARITSWRAYFLEQSLFLC